VTRCCMLASKIETASDGGDVVVVGVSCLDGTRLVLFFPYAEKHHVFVTEEKIKINVIGREK